MNNTLIEQEPKVNRQALTDVQSDRATQEAQAQVILAKRYPRDEDAARERILKSCKRRRLAEVAIYTYPRGGTKVEGPSIRMAEMLGQNWGNLDFGIVELEQRNGESTALAYCWDLETNVRQTKIFQVPHVRHTKRGQTKLIDPRDIYETVANQGARRLRSVILGVIPGDIVDDALEAVNATLKRGVDDIGKRLSAMAKAFQDMGVPKELLEKRLGHNLGSTSESELVELRKIFVSISEGASKPQDWFDFEVEQETEPTPFEQLADMIRGCSDAQEVEALRPVIDKAKDKERVTAEQWVALIDLCDSKTKAQAKKNGG